MDCSKTEEFLKEWKKMCIKGEANCGIRKRIDSCLDCQDYACNNPQEAINIIQQWSDEHQRKTRQSEFLKLFPNARLESGVLEICPNAVDVQKLCMKNKIACFECGSEYWLAEVE